MWFNIKVSSVHHPVTQQEVYELLVMGGTEPSTDGADFYFNMFWFLSIQMVYFPYELIQQGDYAFSTNLKDDYIIFLF